MIHKNKILFLLGATVTTIIFVFLLTGRYFQIKPLLASSTINSPDAIAVRIIPNPNHYSITRWYANQGFQGSPQSLIVDGYQAIRDGRTVYVNAANVNPVTKIIYTNIYLISYNQNPAPNTVDILGQIISHWKFNDNLTGNTAPVASCSISTLNCTSNVDCSANQYCATSGNASSTCLFKTPKNCLSDTDCPTNFFCNSLKSKITRDVKRVGQLEELKIALANFKKLNYHYPRLAAGTYLANNSISLWPSWSQVLLSDLSVAPNLIDPINHLGACPGYSPATCWSKTNQSFFSKPSESTLVLPFGSYALAYSSNSTGSNYNLCATLESRALGYRFYPKDPIASACVIATGVTTGASTINTPPYLVNEFLRGQAQQEFNGFIQVNDANHDPLTWSLTPQSNNWSGWRNSNQTPPAPILKDTSNPNQKKVYAQLAGKAGLYKMTLKVTDGRGGVLSTTTTITILASPLTIIAENGEYALDSGVPFNYSFSFFGKGLSTTPIYSVSPKPNSYSVVDISGPKNFDLLKSLNRTITSPSSDHYKVSYSTNKFPIDKLAQGAKFTYQIRLSDKNNKTTTKDFSLVIVPSHLAVNIDCPTIVRVNNPYACQFTSSKGLSYSASGLPSGLAISNQGIIGTSTVAGNFPINIVVKNNYGAQVNDKFTLKVNTYCGDGIKQTPNSEGAGGINNDGNEICDGNSGITANPALSSLSLQYACQPGPKVSTPYPILTNNQCIFQSPINGGGYCGDGYCQALGADNKPLETCGNCAQDCGICVVVPKPIVISGTVTSYATYYYPSKALAKVKISISDANNNFITSAITNSAGHYSLNIPAGFISSTKRLVATASLSAYDNTVQTFTPSSSQTIDFMLSTPDYQGINKIKLTWGARPRDLDAHLTFGTDYHVWYLNKKVASSSLDKDVTSSYGPENIRIQKYVANNYKFDVYNYSHCSNGFPYGFGTTTVTIYNSHNGVVKVYHADPGQLSCYWHVFGLDNQGNITNINTYNNTGPQVNW